MKRLFFFLLLASSAFAQGPVRQIPTISDLPSIKPLSSAVDGKLSILVGDTGRVLQWNAISTETVDNGCVYAVSTGGGRFIATDCLDGKINVTYFGADPTGTSDSTIAIQSAVNAVEAIGGGVVQVPVGTFKLTDTILSTVRVRIIGASAEASKLVHSGPSTNVMLKLSGTSPWEVSGLTFDGGGVAPCIESYLTAEGLLTKCNIHSFKYFGFKLGSVFNRIAFNRFRDAADTNAVGLLNSMPGSGNTIIGNSFGTSAIGIRMDEPSNGLMIGPGNAFEYNTYGILIPRFAGGIYGGVQDMTIMGNFFEGCTNSPLSIGWGPYTTNSYGHQAFFIGPNAFAQTGNGPIYLDSISTLTVADHNFGPVVRFGTNFTMLHLRNNTYLSATNKVIDYDALKGKLLDQDGVVFVNAGNPPNTNEFKPYFLSGSLGLAQPNPQTRLDVFGPVRSTYNGPLPTNGQGLEFFFDSNKSLGVMNSVDRTLSDFLPFQIGSRYVVGNSWQFIRWPANTAAAMSNPPSTYGALWFTNVSGGTNMALVVRSPSGVDTILGAGGGVSYLNHLSDVNTNSIAVNSILKWDGTNWIMGIDQSTAGTNASTVFINNSTQVDGPSFNDSAEAAFSAISTNITVSLVSGSIASNKLSTVTYDWIERPKGVYVDAGIATRLLDSGEVLFNMSGATSAIAGLVDYSIDSIKFSTNGVSNNQVWQYNSALGRWTNATLPAGTSYTFSTGLTNAAGTVTAALAPGSNITFSTNAQTITISSTASGSAATVNAQSVTNIADGTNVKFTVTGQNAVADLNSNVVVNTVSATTLVVTNPLPNRAITNATASRFAEWGADFRLTNSIAETGTGAPVRSNAPAFTNPTANTQSVGTSNSTLATTAFVMQNQSTNGGTGTTYTFTNGVVNTAGVVSSALAGAGTVTLTTNGSGVVTITGASVTNTPVYGLWQTLGSVDFVVVQYGTTNAAFTYTNYSGVVSNISNIGDTGTDSRLQIRIDFNQNIGTNYLVFADFDGVDDLVSGQGTLFYSQETGRTNTYVELSIVDNGGYQYADYGHKIRIRIIKPDATAGGMGGDVITTANNVMTGSNSFTGGTITVSTQSLSTSNSTAASTAFVMQNRGSGGGDVYTTSNNTHTASTTNTFLGPVLVPTVAAGDNTTNAATTAWSQREFDRELFADRWEEVVCELQGGNDAAVLYPWVAFGIGSGTLTAYGDFDSLRSGVVALRTRATADLNTGVVFGQANSTTLLTNTVIGTFDLFFSATNDVVARYGFTDDWSTTEPVDGVYLSMTNNRIYGVCLSNSVKSVTSTGVIVPKDIWTLCGVYLTNGVATFRVRTNGVVMWSDSLTGKAPIGAGRHTQFQSSVWGSGVTTTNGTALVWVDRIYYKRSRQNR